MDKYISYIEGDNRVTNWVNTVLKNYLKRNPENQSDIEHILDYLLSNASPKRIDRMSYDEAKNNAVKWQRSLIKRAKDIVETDNDVETFIQFKNGARFVRLKGKAAFLREGKLMSHCVGSYSDKSGVKIYSLRDVNNNPHCTIEILESNGAVNQIKGKGNGSIHPKYIKYVLKFLNKVGMDVRDSEMENLGYINYSNYTTKLLLSKYPKLKYVTVNNKMFIYKYQKFEGDL